MGMTTAFKKIGKIIDEPTFYKVIQGGMRAGKTFAIMTHLIGYAESLPETKITVVGQSYPHLRDGAIADFTKIMREQRRFDEDRWNKTEHDYLFANGAKIQFRSLDNSSALGLGRDVLFVNEATAFTEETFQQMADRTTDFVIIDYNPAHKFWAHELVEKQPQPTSFIILTYKDNEALEPQLRRNIESHAPKPGEEPSNWWTVYGLGQIGSLEGNVYSGWIDGRPENFGDSSRLVRYGLDFGFSNDETALVAVYEVEVNDGAALYIEEVVYQNGLLGSQYPSILERYGVRHDVLIVADSARPEIIAEIKNAGYRIVGADKNPGSVRRGIDRVQERQIYYSGSNLKQEYLSYAWRRKRSGEVLDEPQDGNDHLMDALRYAVDDLKRPRFDF